MFFLGEAEEKDGKRNMPDLLVRGEEDGTIGTEEEDGEGYENDNYNSDVNASKKRSQYLTEGMTYEPFIPTS